MRRLKQLIGDLRILSHADQKVSLSYSIPQNGRLSIVIQDQLGRLYFEKDFILSKDARQLIFSLTSLPAGEYHAWITFDGKTAIRELLIPESKSGFNFKTWTNLFS